MSARWASKLTIWVEVAQKAGRWHVQHSPIPGLYIEADTLEDLRKELDKIVPNFVKMDNADSSIKIITTQAKSIDGREIAFVTWPRSSTG